MEVLSLILSCAALLVAGASAVYTGRQAREATRANELLEAEQQRARDVEQATELANRVVWRIEAVGPRGHYVLRNIGTHTAQDVRARSLSRMFTTGPIVSDDSGGHLAQDQVESHASVKFTVTGPAPHIGQGNELLVTWRGQDKPVVVGFPPAMEQPRQQWRPLGGIDF